MSDGQKSRTSWADVAGWLVIFGLFFMFAGEPDIQDAIIHWLMKP